MNHAKPPAHRAAFDADSDARTAWAQSNPVLLVLACFVAFAAVGSCAVHGFSQPGYALAFGFIIAAGEAFRVRLPGGREAAPLGAATALAYAVITEIGHQPALHNAPQAVAVAAFGFLVGSVPHLAVRRPTTLDYTARRFLMVALIAWLFRMFYLRWVLGARVDGPKLAQTTAMDPGFLTHHLHSVSVGAATAAFLVLAIISDGLMGAVLQAGQHRRPILAAARDEVRFTTRVGLAVVATALLVTLASRTMSIWVLPALCLPLAFTQVSLRRFARIKEVHLETIRALSRITEVAGLTQPGHARRVARTCQRIGRELGLSEDQLLDLEYASLMHDIGQLSVAEPVHGGRTAPLSLQRQRELARAGAEVIRRAGALGNAAEIVEHHPDPFGAAGPLPSRILRVANDYDDLAGEAPEPAERTEALRNIRLGLAVHYDPAVVESLSRMVGE
ncbi:HD-GYP domain-containing protein [Catenulispora pinisilvae]|uniref:HD-GYP domain-containing protein n=1 Tax=Catenulispora pinisilvae TaxID=2705253 RepID=UPI001891DBB0|nr:HD domain-containing phosphohydrolase [Catenulispora pinisilvae]